MKRTWMALAAAALLMATPCARAADYVGVREVYEAAQAMGGRWQAEIQTPWGVTKIDAPVVVPDVSALPVITMALDQPLDEQTFLAIDSSHVRASDPQRLDYTGVEIGGEVCSLHLGDEYGEAKGWDAVQTLWADYGVYTAQGLDRVGPQTHHFAYDMDTGAPCLDGVAMTVEDAMALWQAEVERFYPGSGHRIAPCTVRLCGSLLADPPAALTGPERAYMVITGEQIVGGVPVMGAITDRVYCTLPQTGNVSREYDQARRSRMPVPDQYMDVSGQNFLYAAGGADRRLGMTLFEQTGVVQPDVPLAPLETVLDALSELAAQGKLWRVYGVRLGYVLYRDPAQAHCVAMPHWQVDAVYVHEAEQENHETFMRVDPLRASVYNPWEAAYFHSIPVNAQSGEPLLFGFNDDPAVVCAAPQVVTWAQAQ